MKCGLELVQLAKEAEALRLVEKVYELEEAKRLAKECEERTINWCETVLSNYLEQYAINHPWFGNGDWSFEFKENHVMHFGCWNNHTLYPLVHDGKKYSNGEKSYRASREYLELQVIKEYCAKFCIEVSTSSLGYKCYGVGGQSGIELHFRINPKCI